MSCPLREKELLLVVPAAAADAVVEALPLCLITQQIAIGADALAHRLHSHCYLYYHLLRFKYTYMELRTGDMFHVAFNLV